jgi:hypothetical protein
MPDRDSPGANGTIEGRKENINPRTVILHIGGKALAADDVPLPRTLALVSGTVRGAFP